MGKPKNNAGKISVLRNFLFLISFTSFSGYASVVKGHIDTPTSDYENFKIPGWACQTGRNESIEVRILFGGKSGTGTLYRAFKATLPSEKGVATACSNTFMKNRFNLLMPIADVYKHRGKSIFIHGISTIGSGNNLLTNSGKFFVPNVPNSSVIGHIYALTKSGSDYFLRGWACQTNYKTSIGIHVYAGGAVGSGGTHIASGTANGVTGTGVASACKTTGTQYGFNIKIPATKVTSFANKKLYVHGLSLVNSGNLAIGNSDTFSLPSLPGTRTITYEYDALGRLVVHDDSDRLTKYTYDDADNRKTKKVQQK